MDTEDSHSTFKPLCFHHCSQTILVPIHRQPAVQQPLQDSCLISVSGNLGRIGADGKARFPEPRQDLNVYCPKGGPPDCMACHVGNFHPAPSNWISTTAEANTAKNFNEGVGNGVLKIDRKKLGKGAQVADLSYPDGRREHLGNEYPYHDLTPHERVFNRALHSAKENEVVLIKGSIPHKACKLLPGTTVSEPASKWLVVVANLALVVKQGSPILPTQTCLSPPLSPTERSCCAPHRYIAMIEGGTVDPRLRVGVQSDAQSSPSKWIATTSERRIAEDYNKKKLRRGAEVAVLSYSDGTTTTTFKLRTNG
ncbi:hypothetical protein DFJ73DRAFT_758946 [Zopfochytrium polystomum]|nr:hypothetical protein DFJ73DRAFT_758946 [Zopfochytrium polystomum]